MSSPKDKLILIHTEWTEEYSGFCFAAPDIHGVNWVTLPFEYITHSYKIRMAIVNDGEAATFVSISRPNHIIFGTDVKEMVHQLSVCKDWNMLRALSAMVVVNERVKFFIDSHTVDSTVTYSFARDVPWQRFDGTNH